MRDERIDKLADLLVNYSVNCQKGDKVLIEARGIDYPLTEAIIQKVYAAGGYPFVETVDLRVSRAILMGTSEKHMRLSADYAAYRMRDMDCYIGIRGGSNMYENSDVPSDNMQLESRLFFFPVHHEIRVKNTKWVVLRYPNPSMAQAANMSTEAFEDYYFKVCTLDYRQMDGASTPLFELMNKTDRVRLTARDTDISFSIKGIGCKKCCGHMNIPDGEVYSAPVKDSVNGVITYNTPTITSSVRHDNVRLEFKDGKIIKATSSNTEHLNKVLDTDEGARYVGEFAIGINPFISKPMLDILFDEKIYGSIHFTPGCCYDDAFNGNKSAVHWDMVLNQTPAYGGGEIYFDDVLIRKDGEFVLDSLKGLNRSAY